MEIMILSVKQCLILQSLEKKACGGKEKDREHFRRLFS